MFTYLITKYQIYQIRKEQAELIKKLNELIKIKL